MASKKKGLPFVVQPRLKPIVEIVGTEESGQIEIERKGYLTVAEKAIVQNAMKGDENTSKMFAIASKIARASKVSVAQVFDDMAKEERPEYLSKHEEDLIVMLNCMMATEERTRLVAVTALILTRVNADWDAAETSGLHPGLIDAIYELYKDEDKKSVEALEKAAEEADAVKRESAGKD